MFSVNYTSWGVGSQPSGKVSNSQWIGNYKSLESLDTVSVSSALCMLGLVSCDCEKDLVGKVN